MIKIVAFDLDGTVCNTIPLCIETFLKALEPYTNYKLTESDIVSTFGLNETGMVKKLVKDEWENALNDFYMYYEKFHDMCRKPFQGICELIEFLKKKNIPVVLITGKGERSCEITLRKIGMQNVFKKVMYGSEKYYNKADSIRELLNEYNIKRNELIYIGDSFLDIKACNETGVICLSAAWDKLSNHKDLEALNPNHIYDSVYELEQYLTQLLGMNKQKEGLI